MKKEKNVFAKKH